ncbi:MAG: phasin family protein [Gammaproteobacteria bacterium]|nr:phasin family protein [Gammaproteobacteria bacterium]
MSNEMIEKLNEIGQASYKAGKELAEINTKTIEEICEQQLALANLMIENVTTQMKLLGSANDIKEVLNSQSEINADISGKVMGIARNTTDIMNEYKEQCSSWYEKGVKASSSFVPSVS